MKQDMVYKLLINITSNENQNKKCTEIIYKSCNMYNILEIKSPNRIHKNCQIHRMLAGSVLAIQYETT
jgi:hypothetical protein